MAGYVRVILTLALGLIIGLVTNELAIKMLFRPRRRIMLGKWHVPFTPGLIPAQKDRIAKSIGKMVSEHLFDEESIRAVALSKETIDTLREKICAWLQTNAASTDTLREALEQFTSSEQVDQWMNSFRHQAAHTIIQEVEQRNIGRLLARLFMDKIRSRLQTIPFFARLDGGLLDSLEMPIANAINDAVRNVAPGIIDQEIGNAVRTLSEKRICDLTRDHLDKVPALADTLTMLYVRLMEDYLEQILQAVDVCNLVEQKIQAFSPEQLEHMILGIMKKELSAIVWLGGVLGFLMSFVNLLVMRL